MSNFVQSVYQHSPAFVQNLGVSWYGWRVKRREYSKRFWTTLDQFEKQQWYSPGELLAYQNERLIELIKSCYQYVRYYRQVMKDRRLTPADFRTASDLEKLPILTRQDVRNHADDLISANISRRGTCDGYTSGTTGSPLHVIWDHNMCLVKTVVDWRQKRWAGINPDDPIACFFGRQIVPTRRRNPPFWRHNWALNQLLCSSWHLSQVNLPAYVEELEKFQPRAIEGYPSSLSIIARYLLRTGRTLPVKAVFTTSETLLPQQRESIEKAFACKLFDFYGMAERVVFATECPTHNGKHLNSDFGITEFLHGDRPVEVGHMGRVVATGLHNLAMPLVRYQCSDVSALDDRHCECGRGFPLMAEVTTKDEDMFTATDGRYISPSVLNALTKHLLGIAESQLIQEEPRLVVVKIVRLPEYSDEVSRYLQTNLRRLLGREMEIRLEFVTAIPRTASGKFRWVISKVPLDL